MYVSRSQVAKLFVRAAFGLMALAVGLVCFAYLVASTVNKEHGILWDGGMALGAASTVLLSIVMFSDFVRRLNYLLSQREWRPHP